MQKLKTDRTLVIIPVYNEQSTIARVIETLQSYGLDRIRVVDNGSTDRSGAIASAAGAEVLSEPIPGYGQACWRGLQNLSPGIEWILFCDGDGSDDLSQLPSFFTQQSDFDLILGDRGATTAGREVMTPVQLFGNQLATFLIRLGWGESYRDLGPMRLIRRSALDSIQMQDRAFGWTVEMQVRAIECQLRIVELPVGYFPRQGGKSKISGTLSGSFKAGSTILSTIGRLLLHRWRKQQEDRTVPNDTNNLILLGLSAFLLGLGTLLMVPYGDFAQAEAVPQFWLGSSVMSLGFIFSWLLRSVPGVWFWVIAIALRGFLSVMYPGNDIWRYLWEGYIQNLGFSPYEFAPNAPELVPYHTQWHSLINHPDTSAIYPPLAQWGFRSLSAIAPSVLLFKLSFILTDLLTCWLLSVRFGYLSATFYAWNPLILYSFAGGAHYDTWFILPLVAAWFLFDIPQSQTENKQAGVWGVRPHSNLMESTDEPEPPGIRLRRQPKTPFWFCSAFFLGISIAIKWMSLPILSFLTWRAWRKAGIKTAAIVILCGLLPLILTALPFCSGTECPLIPTGSVFVSHGRSAEFIPHLLGKVWQASRNANWIYLIPLGVSGLWILWKFKQFRPFAESYFFALLVLSPIVHAWYFTWLVPFAVASRNMGTYWMSVGVFVYFALPYREALGRENWSLTSLERWFLWLPLVLGGLMSIWQSRGKLE
ncbi:glycosyltransferase family 2 protein [Lusitaniella coriacea LEGE 07157]|uniref:Glycosyltransferase family 2 protein n=1 Tax=Lusitaniella coriacea LEGE 07157 TaxID=945747 RepID=A0A8J7DWH5_9CYAN|nr:glycosyltransferase family 2 protein [Lusitaniella coriacea LEGE 07157]